MRRILKAVLAFFSLAKPSVLKSISSQKQIDGDPKDFGKR